MQPSDWSAPFHRKVQCSNLLGSGSKVKKEQVIVNIEFLCLLPEKQLLLPKEGNQSSFYHKFLFQDHKTCTQTSSYPKCWKRNVHILPVRNYLKMKIKSMRSPKNTATLSMVLSITISCLWRFGKKQTSFIILRSRNVLNTESPEPSSVTP